METNDDILPKIDLSTIDFEPYVTKCPKSFGRGKKTAHWMAESILSGNSLLFETLNDLCTMFYPDPKIGILASHRHNLEDETAETVTLRNCSFYVTIGTKSGYDIYLDNTKRKSFGKAEHSPPDEIHLKTKMSFQSLFSDFFHKKFNNDESDYLEKCFSNDRQTIIGVFARNGTKTEKKNLIRYQDQLIGAACFPNDSLDSVLLTWLAVIQKSLSSLNIHDNFKDNTEPIQTNFSIGRFLIICAQYIKSLLQKKWCPVVCQIHEKEDSGPYLFYLKSFFIKMELYYQLIYEQVTRRPDFIIEGDAELIWMVLHYPLCDLLVFPRRGATSWHDYDIILLRGYYYFLRRKYNFRIQSTVGIKYNQIAGNNPDYMVTGINVELDKNIIDDEDQIQLDMDGRNDDDNVTRCLTAGKNVFNEFANTTLQGGLIFHDCGFGTDQEDKNSLYLALSQLIYGDRIFYLNLRQFLQFYYRSLSKLPLEHPLYQSENMKATIFRILFRIYNEKIPDTYKEDDFVTIDSSKAPIVYNELSQLIMRNVFPGDYVDISIFGAIFGIEFIITDGKSYSVDDLSPETTRKWRFLFSSSAKGDNDVNKRLQKKSSEYQVMYLASYYGKTFVIVTDSELTMFDDLSQIPKCIAEFRDKFDINEDNIITVPVTPVGINNDTDLQEYLCAPNQKKIQNQYNIYLAHSRKLKYFPSQGFNKVHGGKSSKGSDRPIGPMFEFKDFVDAKIPEQFIMPIARCLDPVAVLVKKNVTPIEGEVTFKDLYHLRPQTWLCESSTKIFIDYLMTICNTLFFIDPATYSNKIEFIRQIIRFLSESGIENDKRKDVILMLHLEGHFIIVEVQRSKTIDDNPTLVAIADSLDQDIVILTENLHKLKYLNVFLHILGTPNYEITKADDIQVQTPDKSNECGIICLQRMYALATCGKPSIKNIPLHLQSPTSFRIFVCYITLNHRQNKISPYIAHYHSINKSNNESNNENIFNSDTPMVDTNLITQEFNNTQANISTNDEVINPSITNIESQEEISARVNSVFALDQNGVVPMLTHDDTNITAANAAADVNNIITVTATTAANDNDNDEDDDDDDETTVKVDDSDHDNNQNDDNNQLKDLQPEVKNDADYERKEKAKDNGIVSAEKTKTMIKFTVPQSGHGKFLRTRNSVQSKEVETPTRVSARLQNLVETPTRVSARLQNLVQRKKLFKEKLKSLNIEDETDQAMSRKRIRDPTNKAIGFAVVTKTPKQDQQIILSEKNAKRRAVLKENLERKIEEYDKFVDCENYDDTAYEDLIDDLYADDPFWFIDKALSDKEMDDTDKHDPTIYVPLLYDDHQHNSEKARLSIETEIEDELNEARNDQKAKQKTYDDMNKIINDKTNKKLQHAYNVLQKKNIQIEMLELELTKQPVLLPYDSIYAIQPITNDELVITDYFVIIKNPDGDGYRKIKVTKVWIDEALDETFRDKVEYHHRSKGWIAFDPDQQKLSVIGDADDFCDLIKEYELQPIYSYTPLKGDDQILIVRCEMNFDPYATNIIMNKCNWSVLTKNQTLSDKNDMKDELPSNPLECNENGMRLHRSIYNSITYDLLKEILAPEMIFLLKQASIMHASEERIRPRKLSSAPQFIFADDFGKSDNSFNLRFTDENKRKSSSQVKLSSDLGDRYYDEMDKSSSFKHIMPHSNVGIFTFTQVYYFDLTTLFKTKYYVRVTNNQISGLCYDPKEGLYYGLEKDDETDDCKIIQVDEDWVIENFPDDFITYVRLKAREDQKRFVKVPVGNARKEILSPPEILQNPSIEYLQNGKDNCVFSSLASAIHYMNYTALAWRVFELQSNFMNTYYDPNFESLLGIVQTKLTGLRCREFNRNYQVQKIHNPKKFLLFAEATKNPKILFHIIVRGKDKSSNHCIAIYDNLIFDGNFTNALHLSLPNIKLCMDTAYSNIESGYMYLPIDILPKKKKKKKKNK